MEIRELKSMEEMEHAEKTMKSAFKASDEAIVPDHVFKICSEIGVVLGAYEGETQVGMALGFRGIDDETVYLHVIGVREDYKSQGVGKELMREFLKVSKEKEMRRVNLTYDPLLAGNAALYLRKAGGQVSEYRRNMYGDQNEGANVGKTPTDRFIVEYDLTSSSVEEFMSDTSDAENCRSMEDVLVFEGKELILEDSLIKPDDEGYTVQDIPERKVLGVQIPGDLSVLKEEGGETSARYATREIFENLLSMNYEIVNFISGSKEDSGQNKYILKKS